MSFVSILRAIYEICLKRGWAAPTRAALDMCKMVEKRMFAQLLLMCSSVLTLHRQVEFDDRFAAIQGCTS